MNEAPKIDLPKDVADYFSGLENDKRRADALRVVEILEKVTAQKPKMWGKSMIGFDIYHYKYDSGREGDSFMIGLSPRKQKLVIYIVPGFSEYAGYLDKLGKYKSSVSCLYINKLEDIDLHIFEKLCEQSYKDMKAKYSPQSKPLKKPPS